MSDVIPIGFDYAILKQSAGASFIEAVLIIAMVVFLIWAFKIAMEDVKE